MPPLLSIIIPTYNHAHCLPGLLKNIAGQKFRDFEVILVDDCSDDPYDAIIEAWNNQGFDLRLFRNPCRQYTKNTRLNGVEQARGDLVMFVDADDLLTGDTALGFHVAMLREKNADLLHFQVASYKTDAMDKMDPELFAWTRPLGEYLSGQEIFERYAREDLRSHLVYGKIATRELWQKCMEPARASSIRRYQEDLLLCSLLFFHARSYVGSNKIGYIRSWRDKTFEKSIGRTASLYAMLTEFVPYIGRNGAGDAAIQATGAYLMKNLRNHVVMAAGRALGVHGCPTSDGLIREIEEHCDVATFVKALMTGFPLHHMFKLENENQIFKQHIAVLEQEKEALRRCA